MPGSHEIGKESPGLTPQKLDLNKNVQLRGSLTHWEKATLDASLHLKSDGASPPSSSENESVFALATEPAA